MRLCEWRSLNWSALLQHMRKSAADAALRMALAELVLASPMKTAALINTDLPNQAEELQYSFLHFPVSWPE